MDSHLLLQKAFVFTPQSGNVDLPECYYDRIVGAWIYTGGAEEDLLVRSRDPRKPIAGTKKCDHETGEDQKGE